MTTPNPEQQYRHEALEAFVAFRKVFLVTVGDKSPLARQALAHADMVQRYLATPPAPAEPQGEPFAWAYCSSAVFDAYRFTRDRARIERARQAGFDPIALYAAPPSAQPAPGSEQDAALFAEWMACDTRRPFVVNSLRHRAQEMRAAEKRCRNAYKKDFMGKPAVYLADAFAEAATAFESRIAAMAAQAAQGGGHDR